MGGLARIGRDAHVSGEKVRDDKFNGTCIVLVLGDAGEFECEPPHHGVGDDDGEALLIDVDATETVHAPRRGQSERSM
jgi:hypothetical protein